MLFKSELRTFAFLIGEADLWSVGDLAPLWYVAPWRNRPLLIQKQ